MRGGPWSRRSSTRPLRLVAVVLAFGLGYGHGAVLALTTTVRTAWLHDPSHIAAAVVSPRRRAAVAERCPCWVVR